MPSSAQNIALYLPWDRTLNREIREGVYAYARPHRPWGFVSRDPYRVSQIAPIYFQTVTGGIGRLPAASQEAWARNVDAPLVLVVDLPTHGRAGVYVDPDAIARIAVGHLLGKGLSRLAVYHRADAPPQEELCDAFARHASTRATVNRYTPGDRYRPLDPPAGVSVDFDLHVYRWLRSLEWPIGVYCTEDRSALQLAEICRRTGIEIPEQVAILGAGDDDMKCRLAYPPVSSIKLNGQKIGYEAARLFERIVGGSGVVPESVAVEPAGVEERQSTDVIAADDHEVAAAMQFIREHAHQGISVSEVLEVVSINRRDMERRFKRVLHASPYRMILRTKLEQVCKLLTQTDRTIADIASACGFSDSARMTLAFRKEHQTSPGEYRKRYRLR